MTVPRPSAQTSRRTGRKRFPRVVIYLSRLNSPLKTESLSLLDDPVLGYCLQIRHCGKAGPELEDAQTRIAAATSPAAAAASRPLEHPLVDAAYTRKLKDTVTELEEWKLRQKQKFQQEVRSKS
jgi:uncharacterized heparinase superfamily protein